MGLLTETRFNALVAAGCECGGVELQFRAYLDGVLPVMGGEPVGAITWVYDGEKFIDGIFEICCGGCQKVIFAAEQCPRCDAPGVLPKILASANQFDVPAACPKCGMEELRLFAFVPARVRYERKHADKARTSCELSDPGFHAFRVDCPDCGRLSEQTQCPLCDAPGPLRARP